MPSRKRKKPDPNKFACSWCHKEYAHEATVATHMCSIRNRWIDKDLPESRTAYYYFAKYFRSFVKFGNFNNSEGFETFIRSQYYSAFMKFAHYLRNNEIIMPDLFFDFLVKNAVTIDTWTEPKPYLMFLADMAERENPYDAVSRSIRYMTKWGEENGEHFSDFFRKVEPGRLISMLQSGKISMWAVAMSPSAQELVASFNADQKRGFRMAIDQQTWKRVSAKHAHMHMAIVETMVEAGL